MVAVGRELSRLFVLRIIVIERRTKWEGIRSRLADVHGFRVNLALRQIILTGLHASLDRPIELRILAAFDKTEKQLDVEHIVLVDPVLQIFTLNLRLDMESLAVAQKPVQCGLYEVLHIQRLDNVAKAHLFEVVAVWASLALFLLDIIIFRDRHNFAAKRQLVAIRGLQLSLGGELPQQSMQVVEAGLPVNSISGRLDGFLLGVRHDRLLLRVDLSGLQKFISAAGGHIRLQNPALRARLNWLLRP